MSDTIFKTSIGERNFFAQYVLRYPGKSITSEVAGNEKITWDQYLELLNTGNFYEFE